MLLLLSDIEAEKVIIIKVSECFDHKLEAEEMLLVVLKCLVDYKEDTSLCDLMLGEV